MERGEMEVNMTLNLDFLHSHNLSTDSLQVRKNIEQKVKLQELAAGIDKRAVIEKAIRDELCSLLDGTGGVAMSKPKRGKPYIVMFVGLQVSCCATSNVSLVVIYCLKCVYNRSGIL